MDTLVLGRIERFTQRRNATIIAEWNPIRGSQLGGVDEVGHGRRRGRLGGRKRKANF